MKYPKPYSLCAEPDEIRAGDLVWWNEGVCVGFVEEVMAFSENYEPWGLNEPSIALTNLHPFEANRRKHKQHIGFVTSGSTVVNSADQLEDEAIGLLTAHECEELQWAISEAKGRVASEHRNAPFCVSAVMNTNRREENWIIYFVDQECEIVATAIFPFRPNTRSR